MDAPCVLHKERAAGIVACRFQYCLSFAMSYFVNYIGVLFDYTKKLALSTSMFSLHAGWTKPCDMVTLPYRHDRDQRIHRQPRSQSIRSLVRRSRRRGSGQSEEIPRPHGGWQPVQRQRRWQRGVGVPHKHRSRLQSLFRQRWGQIDNPTRRRHKGPPIEGARALWQAYRRRKQEEV